MYSVFTSDELDALERFGFHLGEEGITKTAAVEENDLINCGFGTYASSDGRIFEKTASSGSLEEISDSQAKAEHRFIVRHSKLQKMQNAK